MTNTPNSFPADPDRAAIWETLMTKDFVSFLQGHWPKEDFLTAEFCGVDCHRSADPKSWTLRYPSLTAYQAEWLRQAAEFQSVTLKSEDKLAFLLRAASLDQIQITGERAMAWKKFNGTTELSDGAPLTLCWQTIYYLKKVDGFWKITGFTGYLPNPMPGL